MEAALPAVIVIGGLQAQRDERKGVEVDEREHRFHGKERGGECIFGYIIPDLFCRHKDELLEKPDSRSFLPGSVTTSHWDTLCG